MGRAGIIALLMFFEAAAGGSARAQVAASDAEEASAAVEQVDAHLSAGHLGKALRAARSAAAAFPENASVRIALGDTLAAAAFHEDALAEYERARQLGVNTPELEAVYGTSLWSAKQTGRAEAVVSAARARWPGHARLAEIWAGLEQERRLRSGKRATFAAGTAQAFAAATAAKVERGALFEFLRDDLDQAFIRSLNAGGLVPGDEFFRGLARGVMKEYQSQPRRLVGYEIDPLTSERNGRTVAVIHVLADGGLGSEQLTNLEKAIGDPRLRKVVDPALFHIINELEPPDRARLLELLRTQLWTTVISLEMELVKRSEGWKVAEVLFQEDSRTASSLLAEVARLTNQGVLGKGSPPESRAHRLGRAIGRLTVQVAFVGLVVWLIIKIGRSRRSRR